MAQSTRKLTPPKQLSDEGKMEEWREAGSKIAAAIPHGRDTETTVAVPSGTEAKVRDKRLSKKAARETA
jgi:hypothetical protein